MARHRPAGDSCRATALASVLARIETRSERALDSDANAVRSESRQ
jgi:hypothetical protein